MTSDWCQYVVKNALEYYPSPEIFNTDQGSQFTADAFVNLIEDNGIRMSMDEEQTILKGECLGDIQESEP